MKRIDERTNFGRIDSEEYGNLQAERHRVDWSLGRFIFVFLFWLLGVATSKDPFAIELTLPTFLIIIWQVTGIRERGFTIDDMFWLCIEIFFVVGPSQSLYHGVFTAPAVATKWAVSSKSELLQAEAVVVLSLFGFILAKGKQKQPSSVRQFCKVNLQYLAPSQTGMLTILGLLGFIGRVVASGGLSNLVAARQEKVAIGISGISSLFLAVHFVAVYVIARDYSRIRLSRIKERLLFDTVSLVFLLVLLSISMNPFNNARFALLATWVPIWYVLFGNRIRFYHVYILMLVGLVFVMPIMSVSTRLGWKGIFGLSGDLRFSDGLVLKDVDVFDTLTYAVVYANDYGHTLGTNLVAILLFFVPRSVWPGKPVVGILVMNDELVRYFRAGTGNLSFYFGSDLYLDFGWLGVFLGFFLVGRCWKWLRSATQGRIFSDGVNDILLGSLPILLRGALGAVEGYFVIQVLVLWAVGRVLEER